MPVTGIQTCALPILELGGWSEVRIVLTFTGITVAFCLLAFVGVMYRYAI